MTTDDWTILGAIAGIVGAAAASVAAWFAILGWESARRSRQIDIRPNPQVFVDVGVGNEDTRYPQVYNVGGAAKDAIIMFAVGRSVFEFRGPLPEHCPLVETSTLSREYIAEEIAPGPYRVLLAVAQDVDGQWWDTLRTEKRIKGDIFEWIDREVETLHLESV